MQFLEEEISEITETTWQAMLGLSIQTDILPTTIDVAKEYWTAKVDIFGAWNGVVVLHGSEQLVHKAASVIFAYGCSELTNQDRKDAMYELANVIAGNIKGLLPGPSHLSLPQIWKTTPEGLGVFHADRVSELRFHCQGQPLLVSLWKR